MFSLIFPDNLGFDNMQIISSGDNLHDISSPIFGGGGGIGKIFQNVVCWYFI